MRLVRRDLFDPLARRLARARARRRPPLLDEPVRTGLIGCGVISERYLQTAALIPSMQVVACADSRPEAALARATAYGVPVACSVQELLDEPSIELVINLTPPGVHFEVSSAAIAAGKSVYSEKPLTVEREDAHSLLAQADAAGLRLGCAPDSALGGGLQSCRKLLNEGAIGTPVGALVVSARRGPEIWHPDPPDWFYQPGAGPFPDIAPYYLTALVHFLGPVRRVQSLAGTSPQRRVIARGPRAGAELAVGTPTWVMALLEFASGVPCSFTVTVDFAGGGARGIQLHGTEGSLEAPDPNTFGGPVRLFRRDTGRWRSMPLTHGYVSDFKGLGAAEMAFAMRTGRPHRASARIACHVVDVMQAVLEAGRTGETRDIESSCEPPTPMPPRLKVGSLGP